MGIDKDDLEDINFLGDKSFEFEFMDEKQVNKLVRSLFVFPIESNKLKITREILKGVGLIEYGGDGIWFICADISKDYIKDRIEHIEWLKTKNRRA